MKAPFRILSIDGGGIRGIIPALVLEQIELRTKRPIHQLFDLIAGTSTGGILALGLTKPNTEGGAQFTAADMVKLYQSEGNQIFSSSLLHRILSVGNILDKKYPSQPIEQVLYNYFGDARLSTALTDVLIPSYEIEKRTAFFFKSKKARMPGKNDFLMRDVARATAAAPTYFEPDLVANEVSIEEGPFALIDGGTYANNPAMCAVVEALGRFDQELGDIFMVSLGTGEQTRALKYETVKNWGVLNWAQPILSVVFHGVSDTVHYQTNLILNKRGKRSYYRLQIELPKDAAGENYKLDDARPATIRSLKQLAKRLIDENESEINDICDKLSPKPAKKASPELAKKASPEPARKASPESAKKASPEPAKSPRQRKAPVRKTAVRPTKTRAATPARTRAKKAAR